MCNSRRNRLPSGPCVRASSVAHGQRIDRGIHAPQVHSLCGLSDRGRSVFLKVEMLYCCGWSGDRFMAGAIAQPHQQFLRRVVDHRGGAAVVMIGIAGIGDVGHEDLVPVGRARSPAHVLHVEHGVAEILVEDARLNLVGGLRGLELLLHVEDGLVGARRDDRANSPAPAACRRWPRSEATRTK